MTGFKLMLTAIIKPSYSLCLILFDIDLLFLVSSHINVEQFFRSYVGWLQNSMIRKNNALEKVDLGQKTGMLNYRTSVSKQFEGLHRQCTISSRVIRSQISFPNVFSKWKSGQVEGTFETPSRQPVNQFGWNLAILLSDSFSKKPCLRILISFFVELEYFFHR